MSMKNPLKKALFLFLLMVCSMRTGGAFLFAEEDTVQRGVDELAGQAELVREPEGEEEPAEEVPVIEIEEKKEAEITAAGPSFRIAQIRISGNTLFSGEELEKIVASYEGRESSFREIRELATKISYFYRAEGYSTSRAYIPPQRIENGIVNLQIIEGRVGNLFVEDNRWYRKNYYQSMFGDIEGKIFRYQDLERALYYLNQKPDIKAKAYLIAGKTPGSSDIVIKTEEKFPLHAGYEFNTYGTKSTHRARHILNLENNNLIGMGDSLAASLIMAEEAALNGFNASYTVPLNQNRTILGFSGSYSDSLLIKDLAPLEVEGESWSVIPSVTHFFKRNPQMELGVFSAFEIKDSQTTVREDKIHYDRMRVFRIGPRFNRNDRWGSLGIGTDIHWGIPEILGGSHRQDRLASRPNSGGNFVYFSGNLSRTQKLPRSAFLLLKAAGQWSPVPLTSVEQFRLGGHSSVRGYPESESAGDRGYLTSAELLLPPYFLPQKWQIPFTKKTWYKSTKLVLFYDLGKTFLEERAALTSKKDKFLMGTGFGVRFYLQRSLSVNFDLGFPIGDNSSDEKDQKIVHLSVRTGF